MRSARCSTTTRRAPPTRSATRRVSGRRPLQSSHVTLPALAIIVNPISGRGGGPDRARDLLERAADLMLARGVEPQVFVTERPGHARELAAAAVRQGVGTVVAWGGDGTVNEVASAVAFSRTRLGIVPSGSGNGLAGGLGLPSEPFAALSIALGTSSRAIDVAELDGRLFVNIAGVGLDANIAGGFAEAGRTRRGFLTYARVTVEELARFRPASYRLLVDGRSIDARPLLIAIANGRQYGNGAVIAPNAELDDGRLDVVVVANRSLLRALTQVPRLFMGQADRVAGVDVHRVETVTISSDAPIRYHVDGEPGVGGRTIQVRVRPQSLQVMVPTPTTAVAGEAAL